MVATYILRHTRDVYIFFDGDLCDIKTILFQLIVWYIYMKRKSEPWTRTTVSVKSSKKYISLPRTNER